MSNEFDEFIQAYIPKKSKNPIPTYWLMEDGVAASDVNMEYAGQAGDWCAVRDVRNHIRKLRNEIRNLQHRLADANRGNERLSKHYYTTQFPRFDIKPAEHGAVLLMNRVPIYTGTHDECMRMRDKIIEGLRG